MRIDFESRIRVRFPSDIGGIKEGWRNVSIVREDEETITVRDATPNLRTGHYAFRRYARMRWATWEAMEKGPL